MKQFSLKRLALCAVALLTVGAASAAAKTYDFTGIVTSGAQNPNYSGDYGVSNIKILGSQTAADESVRDFDGRFALTDASINGWKFRYNSEGYKGLWAQYDNKSDLYIIGLNTGDKITINYSASATSNVMKIANTSTTLEHNSEYTVTSDGDLHLVANAAGVHILNIMIEAAATSETVHFGKTTEYYDFEAFGKKSIDNDGVKDLIDPLSVEGETFNNRFSTQQANCFAANGSGWGFQINWNKWFSINNLKAGDQVKIHFTNQNAQVLNFDDPTLVGKTAEDKLVVTDTWYTLYSDADKLKLNNTVNTNNYKTNYLNITIITTNEAITATTLCSNIALDFTGISGVKAYVATAAANGTVTFTQVNKVPAYTPLYLTTTAAGKYVIPALEGDAETISTNLLKGSSFATTSLQSTDAIKYYVYGVKSGVSGFYPVSTTNNFTSAKGKAYLQLTAAQASSAPMLWLNFDENGGTTGINTVNGSRLKVQDSVVYNLAGQRVDNPTKGLYIVNGRKVVIK